jgi:hypothetical protein
MADFAETAGTLAVAGKVVRITGKGLIDVLRQRRSPVDRSQHPVIMSPSTAATWRDPNNFDRPQNFSTMQCISGPRREYFSENRL